MKADLTRKSFDPLKHFAQVLMQQGRPTYMKAVRAPSGRAVEMVALPSMPSVGKKLPRT